MTKYFNVLLVFFVTVTFLSAQTPTPNDWYYGNPGEGFNGISMHKAYNEFLKNKKIERQHNQKRNTGGWKHNSKYGN